MLCVTITVHKRADIDTPAFRTFLTRAVEIVSGSGDTVASVEANMPWKKDGEKYQFAIQTDQGEKTAEATFIESGKLATSIGGNLVVFDRAN